MMRSFALALGLVLSPACLSAEELSHFQTLYDLKSVTSKNLRIQLDPVDDDVRFSVTMIDQESGFQRRHEFEGQGLNDVTPYLLEERYACGVDYILLTVEYPWRHDLPQYVLVLDTFAFRASDFEYIDHTFGSLTDIAIMDSWNPERDLDMMPPVLVECLPERSSPPFRFVKNPMIL